MAMGLTALDPVVANAEKAIENMPPEKAIQFLLSKGVDPRLAGLVMKNRLLKQAMAQGQAQQPQRTVSQEIDDKVNALAGQRGAGISGLPVSSAMFGSPQSMAGGGLVAFDVGGMTDYPASRPASGMPTGGMEDQIGQFIMAQRVKAIEAMQRAPSMQVPGPNQSVVAGPNQAVTPGPAGVAPQGYVPSASPTPIATPAPRAAVAMPPPNPDMVNLANSARTLGGQPTGIGQQQQFAGASMGIPPSADRTAAIEASMRGDVAQMKQEAQQFVPKTIRQNFDDLTSIAESQGIGNAAKAHLAELDQRKAAIDVLAKQGKWAAIANAGFAMAQEATRNPHGGFLGALAVGGQEGAKEYMQSLKDYRQLSNQIQDASYAVKQSQENLLSERTKEALDEHNKETAHYESMLGRIDAAEGRMYQAVYGKELANIQARAMRESRAMYNPDVQFAEALQHLIPGSPEYNTVLQRMRDFHSNQGQVLSAEARGMEAKELARQKLMEQDFMYRNSRTILNTPYDESDKEAVAKYNKARAYVANAEASYAMPGMSATMPGGLFGGFTVTPRQ